MGRLLIHFEPGARGDFLASVILGTWEDRNSYAMVQPEYAKVHYVRANAIAELGQRALFQSRIIESYDSIKRFKGLKIRIDPGIDATNLLEIAANHTIKNLNKAEFSIDDYDSMYIKSVEYINIISPEVQKQKRQYDYWIDYRQLSNIDFLKDLYAEVNHKEIDSELLEKIIRNIDNQPKVKQDHLIINLIKLLDFEISNNCLNKVKYFNMLDNLKNIDDYLNINNYQKD